MALGNDWKAKFARLGLTAQAKKLFDAWFRGREDLVLESAGRHQFVDWIVTLVAKVDPKDLPHWYELRAAHVRAKEQSNA